MNICDYGCGQEANHFFPRVKKWCCCKSTNSCPSMKQMRGKKISEGWTVEKRKKAGEKIKEKFKDIEYKEKQREGLKNYFKKEGSKEKASEVAKERFVNETVEDRKIRKDMHKQACTDEVRERQSLSALKRYKNETDEDKKKRSLRTIKTHNTAEYKKNASLKSRLTIEKIHKKYPLFSIIEDMKYSKNGDIQTRCSNHKCKNSKEKDGWFTPDMESIRGRIYALERENGNESSYLYCSKRCQHECPLFNMRSDPNAKEPLQRYSDEVLKETYRTVVDYPDKIPYLDVRGNKYGYHLDHKYSIVEGFENKVEPSILGHWCNLEVIKNIKNLRKNRKCSITLDNLLKEIKKEMEKE